MKKYIILQIVLSIIGLVIVFTFPEYLPHLMAFLVTNFVLFFGLYWKLGKKHNNELAFFILSIIVFLFLIRRFYV